MGKTSSKVKDRYNAKAYDELKIRIPKGQKTTIAAFAQKTEDSINGVTNKALLAYMGLQDWPKFQATDEDGE